MATGTCPCSAICRLSVSPRGKFAPHTGHAFPRSSSWRIRAKALSGSPARTSAASSASSAAGDDGDAVDLADDYVGRDNRKGQKRAVKLDEIGPRMELRLIKVVEGLPGKEGGVLYHEFGEFARSRERPGSF